MEIGIRGKQTFTVDESMLAVNVGSGEVNVLATPILLMAIEKTASESVKPYLQDGQTTVGIQASFSHSAATPKGMDFYVETELASISANGKILNFVITAYDGKDKISEGTHQRAIVTKQRFEDKAQKKLERKV